MQSVLTLFCRVCKRLTQHRKHTTWYCIRCGEHKGDGPWNDVNA